MTSPMLVILRCSVSRYGYGGLAMVMVVSGTGVKKG